MEDKNIFGYPPEKVAREAAEVEKEREERKEWVDSLQKEQEKKIFGYVSKKGAREDFIYPPQKWGDKPREVNSKKEEEKVVHPSHYQLGELGIEAMDVMRAVMTKEQLKGFYIGNAIKYTLRAEKKNGLEDYKKARYYLDEMIKGEE